jgi:hypothetical protein
LTELRQCRIFRRRGQHTLTIVETPAYLRDATKVLSDGEPAEIVTMLAYNPACGELVVAGAGIRRCVSVSPGAANEVAAGSSTFITTTSYLFSFWHSSQRTSAPISARQNGIPSLSSLRIWSGHMELDDGKESV